jgi:fructose-bisphosphate aldolase class II
MTKINVATQLNKVFTAAVRDCLAADVSLVDPRRYGAAGRDAIVIEVARLLRVIRAPIAGQDASPRKLYRTRKPE